MAESYYDTAQICLNGHVITSSAGSFPQFRQEFCDRCGEATLMNCPKCNKPIRGTVPSSIVDGDPYEAPSFCCNCGSPFPWTQRKQQAAIDLFNEESEDEQERKKTFQESVEQITKDTPQAQVASKRLKRFWARSEKKLRQRFVTFSLTLQVKP